MRIPFSQRPARSQRRQRGICRRLSLGAALVLAAAVAPPVLAAPVLPPPGVASVRYDDFYSYSTQVLDYLDPTAGWRDGAGTGLLDVIVTTRSAGQTNSTGVLAQYNFPEPIVNPNTSPIDGVWGGQTELKVADLYRYLREQFQANTPVFTFDQNETGGNPDLFVTAKVDILDGPGGPVLRTWALDAIENTPSLLDNGIYDDGSLNPAALVTAPGLICLPPIPPAVDPTCFDNNVGSGKFDYLIYAPTMNLSPYADADNIFRVTWHFGSVDDGGEEITLTGRFVEQVQVPAPAPLLLALGMLPWLRRRARAAAPTSRP